MSLDNIFGRPKILERIGKVFPILMKDYDEFMEKANVISYTYDHFNLDEISRYLELPADEIKLLDLVTLASNESDSFNQTFTNLSKVFCLALRKEVYFGTNSEGVYFHSDSEALIDRNNYDDIRALIMEQNLIFTPKVFKDKLMQEWAEKVLQVRAKSSVNITLEDMVTTIAVLASKRYSDLENYTYYQLRSEFQRIIKIKTYETTSLMLTNPYAASEVKLEHFAEFIGINEDPYKDIFKSKSELNNINKALG